MMAKITQPDIYLLEIDSHDIRILDYAICALKDKLNQDKFHFSTAETVYPEKLESMHSEVLRVFRDGHV
jgi:hypothetical protein